MPHNVRHSTRAKSHFDDIKADSSLIRQWVLRQPKLREHHNLMLLRRRHVHPRSHPAATPAQRLHLNNAQRLTIKTQNIQLAANATPSSRADIFSDDFGTGCFQKPGGQVFPQPPSTL